MDVSPMVNSTWPSHVDSSRTALCLMDSSVPTDPLVSMRQAVSQRPYSLLTRSNLEKIKVALTTTFSTRLRPVSMQMGGVCYTAILWTKLCDLYTPAPLVPFVMLWTLIWTISICHSRTQAARRYSRLGSEGVRRLGIFCLLVASSTAAIRFH